MWTGKSDLTNSLDRRTHRCSVHFINSVVGGARAYRSRWGRVGFGDKKITIPLIIIAIAISLSGIPEQGIAAKIAPAGVALGLLTTYFVSRTLGRNIFAPLAVGAVVASLGVIACQIWLPGVPSGGFIFQGNYNIATGFILLGAVLFFRRGQWLLVLLGVIALFLSGSAEAVFTIGVVGLVVLFRRDWSRRLGIIAGTCLLVGVIFFGSGVGLQTYQRVSWAVGEVAPWLHIKAPEQYESLSAPLGGRLLVIEGAMSNIEPLGTGYDLTKCRPRQIVHNVPLVIVQQLGWPGILAALAWLWVSIWCLVKTRLKYAWALILSLSVFDHFVWTQLAPVWWMVVGVSSIPNVIGSDLLFRRLDESADS
jgi:hypothetical protein